jgi:hypothetical protein
MPQGKIDTITYVAQGLIKEPVTFLNAGAVMVSMTNIEFAFKIIAYTVSIVASILVSRKYLLEIKKLKDQDSSKR